MTREVWVQYKVIDITRFRVPRYTQDSVSKHASTDHHRSPLSVEVVHQLAALVTEFVAAGNANEATRHVEIRLQEEPYFCGADPVGGANEFGRFVAELDETLLDVSVGRHRFCGVALVPEPRHYGLQGPVGTAPLVVIEFILHVVVVAVDALRNAGQARHIWRFQTNVCIVQMVALFITTEFKSIAASHERTLWK